MSYTDDEELKIGEFAEEDDADLDLDAGLPLDDDTLLDDDIDESEGVADLDGSEY
jgi:hypothetical protein